MKNMRIFPILLVVLTLALCAFAFVSCGEEEPSQPTSQIPKKLTAPIVVLTDDTVTWSADPTADRFEISINGNLSYVENSVVSRKLNDGETFKIRAIGDGVSYKTSEWSLPVTYTAPPPVVVPTYTVTWKNGDTVLKTEANLAQGTVPAYTGATPTKEATAQYTYVFSGWTPDISEISGDVTYEAQFTKTLRTYTVTFYSEDGAAVLDEVVVDYGAAAVYTKLTPVKNTTEGYSYMFEKWVTLPEGAETADLSAITGDLSVYASFISFVRMVDVQVVVNNAEWGSVSVSTFENVAYGASVRVNGNIITIGTETVVAEASIETAQYTYAFVNWNAPATVEGNTILTANFARLPRTYTITWKNGDTVLELDENVLYGVTPVYNGTVPTKVGDFEHAYVFSGWSPSISSVSGDVTYQAQFVDASNKYTVVFYDEDGVTELGRVVVSYGETAEYPNALPTKSSDTEISYTFSEWVTEVGGNVVANFENITANKVVYAKYVSSARLYTVTFNDYDGTLLESVEVPYGGSATISEEPERRDYRFIGWSRSFDCVTADIVVEAQYIRQYIVEFLNYDFTVLDVQYVDEGTDAKAPMVPARIGYTFKGWNTSFTNVKSDLTVKAEFVKSLYKVTFVDHKGTVLKEEWVKPGASATPPVPVAPEGYRFNAWDIAYQNVSADITVTAIFTLKIYTVTFVLPNGAVIDEQMVEHGFGAEAPIAPRYYPKASNDFSAIYAFTGWQGAFNAITADTVVTAVYDTICTEPVIVLDFDQNDREGKNIVNLNVYSGTETAVIALEFTICFQTKNGNIYVDQVEQTDMYDMFKSGHVMINNNEKTISFVWANTDNGQTGKFSQALTFTMKADSGAIVGEDTFVIENCYMVVKDSTGENTYKITPAIVIVNKGEA